MYKVIYFDKTGRHTITCSSREEAEKQQNKYCNLGYVTILVPLDNEKEEK